MPSLACSRLLPLLLLLGTATGQAQAPPLRDLEAATPVWRTPRSGEGVRGSAFGSAFEVAPRDRHQVLAWTAGIASAAHADESAAWPYGSVYLWDRAPGDRLLRAVLAGVYNDAVWATEDLGPAFAWSSYTPPWSSGELVDGEIDDAQKVHWGYLRPAVGFGSLRQVGPEQDNLLANRFWLEPGYLYFARADRTAAAFALPKSTFELRARWQLRWDELERNLLELPHDGLAFGLDGVWGWRAHWRDSGLPGSVLAGSASGRDYAVITAYLFGIGDLPLAEGNDRWRLLGSLHAGAGDTVDRFSAPRVGGGPDLRGEEWDTTARPLLPGSALGEFFPRRYAVASIGVRRELAWWAHLDLGGTVAWLDRDRVRGGGVERVDDVLSAVSSRLVCGFVGGTRLLLGYAYGFDVQRSGERGGHEVTLQVSGRF